MAKAKFNPEEMRIVTNPDYDRESEPSENEFALANPVRLNNELILLANHMLTLATHTGEALQERQAARLDKKKAERQLEDFERRLLRDVPLSASEAKSLKTIEAAVARRAQDQAQTDKLNELRKAVRMAEDAIDAQDGVIERGRLYWSTAEKMSDNIKTHLSWVKDERKRVMSGYAHG